MVERDRLLNSLTEGLAAHDGSFVVINAPAGYGKSVLLAQWMDAAMAAGRSVGWCSIEKDDRDPCVLWESILTAISVVGAADLDLPLPPTVEIFEPHSHRRFLNEARAALEELRDGTALIFDDVHTLNGTPSETEFRELLAIAPPNVHIVFATRTAFADQRARLSRRVWEIDAESLLFTQDETTALFRGVGANAETIAHAFHTAAGWPAVLSFARLATENSTSQHRPALELIDPDIVYEYFEREIFDQLAPESHLTLLTFAISPLMSADLVDAILQRAGSAPILRRLARDNPVIQRAGSDAHGRTWYCVNQPFGIFLQEKLLGPHPELLRHGTEIAIGWHLEHGDPLVALQLATRPAGAALMDVVLRSVGCDLVASGHSAALLSTAGPLISAVPAGHPSTRGAFSLLIFALAAVSVGEIERAEELLAIARPTELADPALMGSAPADSTLTLTAPADPALTESEAVEQDWLRYIVNVRIALAHGEYTTELGSGRAETTISSLPRSLRTAVHLTRGLAQTRVGAVDSARHELDTARIAAESFGDLASHVMSLVGLAATAMERIDVRETVAYAERAIALSGETRGSDLSAPVAIANVLLAWARHELCEGDVAAAHAEQAMLWATQHSSSDAVVQAKHVHELVNFDSLPDRRRIAQEFTTAWPPSYVLGAPPSVVVLSLHFGLQMARVLGEPRWSERLLGQARDLIGDGFDLQVACALVGYSTGRHATARGILTPLLDDTHAPRTPISEIIAWSLQAVLDFESGNYFRAHATMSRALDVADSTGAFAELMRTDPATVRAILARDMDRYAARTPAAEQLIVAGARPPDSALGHLTPKERELLSELKSLRTVAEISADMLLSVNTVKTHMRGIYRKLDVSSRRRAVSEAERRGLL